MTFVLGTEAKSFAAKAASPVRGTGEQQKQERQGNRISGSFFVAAPDNWGGMKPAQVRQRKRLQDKKP